MPQSNGIIAGAVALVAVVSQYSALGSGLLFLQYVSADHTQFRLYWGNILLSTGLLGVVLTALLHLTAHWLTGAATLSVLLPIAISDCVFQQLISCAGQVFQAFECMKYSAFLSLASNLVRLILAAGMIVFLHHAQATEWAWAMLTVSWLTAVLAFAIITRMFGLPRFSLRLFARRAKEGVVYAVSGSTTAVYNDIDKVLLSRFGMTGANGIYSMAYRALNIGAIPIASLASAAFPSFFKEGRKGIRATVPMARALLVQMASAGALVSVALFALAPLLPRIAGPSYGGTVAALRWLCLIPLFRCFHLSAGDAIAGAGYQKYRLVTQAIAAAGNLGLNLALIPHYAWLGAAWASLVTDASLGIMNWSALYLLDRRDSNHRAIFLEEQRSV